MEASGAGAIAGGFLGFGSSLIALGSENKSIISQIKREGTNLAISMRTINQNRDQLDRELGDILSANALESAKNMATASMLMSTSGTIGGTTAQVAKQTTIDLIKADADTISQARNQDIALLNKSLSDRINFRNMASSARSQIKSPLEAVFQTLTSTISGGSTGAAVGSQFSAASAPKPTIG